MTNLNTSFNNLRSFTQNGFYRAPANMDKKR